LRHTFVWVLFEVLLQLKDEQSEELGGFVLQQDREGAWDGHLLWQVYFPVDPGKASSISFSSSICFFFVRFIRQPARLPSRFFGDSMSKVGLYEPRVDHVLACALLHDLSLNSKVFMWVLFL